MYYPVLSSELEAVYKVLGINSAILLHLYGYDENFKILIIFLQIL